jgi:hypothetical protein
MYGSSERTINFKRPIPVHITYQTAFVDDGGKTQARADIYGLDRDLLNVLRGDSRTSDSPIARNYNSSSKPVMSSATTTTGMAASSPRSHRVTTYRTSPGYTTWDIQGSHPLNIRSDYQPGERSRIW